MAHRFRPGALRDARLAASYTQHSLALAAGLRVDVIARAEQGRHVPEAETLASLAHVLGISLADLFEIDGEAVPA